LTNLRAVAEMMSLTPVTMERPIFMRNFPSPLKKVDFLTGGVGGVSSRTFMVCGGATEVVSAMFSLMCVGLQNCKIVFYIKKIHFCVKNLE